MNRDTIETQTCYIHQYTNKGMLMYIACLCPNLVSVHFYAIPILHSKFPKFKFLLVIYRNNYRPCYVPEKAYNYCI